jgi:RNA methyltransferase, TrmH family
MNLIEISSPKNPRIKQVVALEKSRERKKSGLFPIEGKIEIGLAIASGVEIESVFFSDEIVSVEEVKSFFGDSLPREVFQVTKAVFSQIAYRESTGGMLVLAKTFERNLQQIKLRKNPLILIAEGVEKPGNLGALLRTADAADLDAVIICDPQTELSNPNVVRSSVGCVFTRQVVAASSEETLAWLKSHGFQIFATALTASVPYHTCDFTGPTAILMGTESTGLSDFWLKASDQNIIIPMSGSIDSMNVSVAAAIVIFEAKRQRGF